MSSLTPKYSLTTWCTCSVFFIFSLPLVTWLEEMLCRGWLWVLVCWSMGPWREVGVSVLPPLGPPVLVPPGGCSCPGADSSFMMFLYIYHLYPAMYSSSHVLILNMWVIVRAYGGKMCEFVYVWRSWEGRGLSLNEILFFSVKLGGIVF